MVMNGKKIKRWKDGDHDRFEDVLAFVWRDLGTSRKT
jgi:hypothetical protein